MINRRDFLKLLGASLAIAATPKALLEIEPQKKIHRVTGQFNGHDFDILYGDIQLAELRNAICTMSIKRLDSLGIEVDGLCDIKQPDAWRKEVIRRYSERLVQA